MYALLIGDCLISSGDYIIIDTRRMNGREQCVVDLLFCQPGPFGMRYMHAPEEGVTNSRKKLQQQQLTRNNIRKNECESKEDKDSEHALPRHCALQQ